MAAADFKSVDQYIAAQPHPACTALETVRAAIRKAIPKADEIISYKIPAYRLPQGVVIWFAGWKKHYSLYPATDHVGRRRPWCALKVVDATGAGDAFGGGFRARFAAGGNLGEAMAWSAAVASVVIEDYGALHALSAEAEELALSRQRRAASIIRC